MICDIFSYDFFKNSKSTLKDTSFDKTNNEYMTESLIEVVDFDKATKRYYRKLKLEPLSSNDALLQMKNKDIVFIEFKNGRFSNRTKNQLDKKNADSIKVSCNILKISPEELKPHCDYILVYNLQKNQMLIERDVLEANNEIQQSLEYNKIGSWSTKLAKKEYVAFGLRKYENKYFSKVHTFVKKELDEYLIKFFGECS